MHLAVAGDISVMVFYFVMSFFNLRDGLDAI